MPLPVRRAVRSIWFAAVTMLALFGRRSTGLTASRWSTSRASSATRLASSAPTSASSSSAAAAAASASAGKLNFYTTSEVDFVALMKQWGQPAFRAKQVRSWVYDKGVLDFGEMKDLPLALRAQLSSAYTIGSLRLASEQVSKDGTRKRAYELHDRQLIESVLMPYDDGRFTACISSQAGCAMGCVFCATGQMGFFRQLTATEIFEQAQRFSAELRSRGGGGVGVGGVGVGEGVGEGGADSNGKTRASPSPTSTSTTAPTSTPAPARLSNVVLMGMGEPLANYDNVMEAIRRMNTELGIGARHITISTVGLSPRIRKLADEGLQVGLAVSLHQANDAARSALMPVNERYPIPELLDACRYYVEKTNRRISFEWALIRGQTDSPETAHELGRLLQGLLCHVNVIPLNPTAGFGGKPTPKAGVDEFCRVLGTYGIAATPRTRRGIDIDAGCGQLKQELLRRTRPAASASAAAAAAGAAGVGGEAQAGCSSAAGGASEQARAAAGPAEPVPGLGPREVSRAERLEVFSDIERRA